MLKPVASRLRKAAEDLKEAFRLESEDSGEYSTNKPSVGNIPNDEAPDQGYKAPPKIKPPRRDRNSVSKTREYGRDYMTEYRQENGNGYFKKPKKDPGGPDSDDGDD